MTLHRELFKDLPSAETLRKDYAGALAEERNADGYYVFVQEIAEKYGDQAYELAEEVFREMGMVWDPALLRAPESVRRAGYNNEGANIYNVQVKPFAPEMTGEVIRLYNEQIRKVSYDALMDEDYFNRCIRGAGRLLVALNESGQPVGFVHCLVDGGQGSGAQGSVEMLIYSHGRIYHPVQKELVKAAREFFAQAGVKEVKALAGRVLYPFYSAVKEDCEARLAAGLPQIAAGLKEIAG